MSNREASKTTAVRAWIDQGLAWPENITFLKHEPANLKPREIAAPAAKPLQTAMWDAAPEDSAG